MGTNKNFFDQDFNLLVFIQLLIMLFGIVWMTLEGLEAASKYLTIFLTSISVLVLLTLFIREESKGSIFQSIRMPFRVSYVGASALYILGWLIPILLQVVAKVNTSRIMAPFAAGSINQELFAASTTFEAAVTPFFQFFNTVWTAGTLEEFVWGFVTMVLFATIALGIMRALKIDYGATANKVIYFVAGLIGSGATFAVVHKFNPQYFDTTGAPITGLFLAVIVFRLFLNSAIYLAGLALSFTIGYHQSNNAVWYYHAFGWESIQAALLTPGGIVMMLFYLVIIVTLLANIKDLPGFFSKLWKDLKRFNALG